ncbi:DUF262 domain-containing protein [Thioflexithrix psekupsensis]|uniref:GmrSD restriction endonucleases N-terminal domain-containing protein n=1 Tax=Thioflexithrix psekupsensis TaxID=1570016 RepID=A0A251X4L5_9GAMM|nr:DUF262 domain-containing protein [Thioflexithrix psekupsensis]OUD11649.1 hypothetical protein TPSD3_16465 [Thioflexithrix psekupsensis]
MSHNESVNTEENELEQEEAEDEIFAGNKPLFDPKDIDIVSEQNSLSTIVSMIEDEAIDMNPDFQRSGDLWDNKIMSRLIESILLRLPLPVFYFDASDNSKWLIVDGLQRLSTLKKFMIDKTLKLTDLQIYTSLNDKGYDDLASDQRRAMARYQLITYLIKPGTPKEVKYDIFRRINTGGLKLTPQEIRHTLNQGKPANYLKELVEDNVFKTIVNMNDKRMQARELVLRYLAFSIFSYTDYPLRKKERIRNFTEFLDDAMEKLSSIDDNTLKMYKFNLQAALHTCNEIFGHQIFSKSIMGKEKNKKNPALFEVWTVLIARLSDEERKNLSQKKGSVCAEFADKLKNDDDFFSAISRSTLGATQIKKRFETIESIIRKYSV